VVVHYLDIKRIVPSPSKANPVLVIDPNAMLPAPIAAQRFQAQSAPCRKIGKRHRGVEHGQLL
jgi:hypothetical protein